MRFPIPTISLPILWRARTLLALSDEIWSEIQGRVVSGPVRLGLPYDLTGSPNSIVTLSLSSKPDSRCWSARTPCRI